MLSIDIVIGSYQNQQPRKKVLHSSSFNWLQLLFLQQLSDEATMPGLASPNMTTNLGYCTQYCSFIIVFLHSGEALPAAQHSWEHKKVVPLVLTFSVLGYLAVEFVLLLVQHFGATNAEIVKSSRRVLQVREKVLKISDRLEHLQMLYKPGWCPIVLRPYPNVVQHSPH